MTIKHAQTLLILLLFAVVYRATVAAPLEIRLAYVGDAAHPAYAGMNQGLSEANLQGQFLNQKYSIDSFATADQLPHPHRFLALITAVSAADLLRLREDNRQVAIFNVAAKDDSLRSTCLGNILSTIPSEQMEQDAIAQWQQKHPAGRVSASAWHEDFEKFAGRDLNKRFRKSVDRGMDDYAWAAWAALRMVADAVSREKLSDPTELLDYLKTNLSFDGQKGVDMSFSETGELRQTLLILENGQLLGEAPVKGVSDDLDSLGIHTCAK